MNAKRVCIIGGGPAGIAAAKHLLAERHFEKIAIYEQRNNVGGVWNYTPALDKTSRFPVPHTSPDVPLDTPTWTAHNGGEKQPEYQSPMYERLEANLPKMLMQHSDLDFPQDAQLFPEHDLILQYLERYAADAAPESLTPYDQIRHLVTFETQVTHVARDPSAAWTVTTTNVRSKATSTASYDAIIIASGHYNIPFVPPYPGLAAFNEAHPIVIIHSKYFTRPEDFSGKHVLVVGTGPSGSDIAAQIARHAKHLHISSRSTLPPSSLPSNSSPAAAIASFDLPTRTVHFADGATLAPDAIVFCTGYVYSYPFLPADLRSQIVQDGSRLHGVYRHLFATADPSLAFLTLPWNIVPFPVAEAQGAVVARVWSGRLALPARAEMEAWERRVEDELGVGKGFHKLAPPRDVNYINELRAFAETASGHGGKEPPYWGPRERWMRENVPVFKRAFAALGDKRKDVRTLEELGFEFEGGKG